MPRYRPSELSSLLQDWGTRAKKSLSQNFLIDGNIVRKIVKGIPLQEGDLVVEIGPGPGALTEELCQHPVHILSIEKDRIFAEKIALLHPSTSSYQHHHYEADFLSFPLRETLSKLSYRKAHVVGNLPYSLTTPLLEALTKHHDLFSSITVMVQDEVAKRICASKKTKDYGSLSVWLRYYYQSQYLFTVKPSCFLPKPKVNSAIVSLTPSEKRPLSEKDFLSLTRTGFNFRRKALKVALKNLFPKEEVIQALDTIEKSPLTRAEELSFDEWMLFAQALLKKSLF